MKLPHPRLISIIPGTINSKDNDTHKDKYKDTHKDKYKDKFTRKPTLPETYFNHSGDNEFKLVRQKSKLLFKDNFATYVESKW